MSVRMREARLRFTLSKQGKKGGRPMRSMGNIEH